MSDTTMHPRTVELLADLDDRFGDVRETYERIPLERRDARPRPEAWSPNEIVSHLAILERRLAALFGKLIAEARVNGVEPETDASPVLPTIDVSRVLDRARKITAPAAIDPRNATALLSWSDFEASRAAFKSAFVSGDGLALGKLTYSHPVFGSMGLYEWAAFVAAHGARHADQMREFDDAVAASTAPAPASASRSPADSPTR